MVKAVGRTGLFSFVAVLNLAAILTCVTLFAMVGQSGVAVALGFLMAAILSALVWLAVQHRLLGGLTLLQTLVAPAGATLVMAVAVKAVSAALSGQPAWLVLCAVVPAGTVVYGIGLWFAAAEHLRAAATTSPRRSRQRSRAAPRERPSRAACGGRKAPGARHGSAPSARLAKPPDGPDLPPDRRSPDGQFQGVGGERQRDARGLCGTGRVPATLFNSSRWATSSRGWRMIGPCRSVPL